jgi:predicted O-methyltransferase YrrM
LGKLYTIDRNYSRFIHKNFSEELKSGTLVLIEGDSASCLGRFPDETFDWIYIDAGHDYAPAKKDSVAALPKLKPRGLLVYNDFTHFSSLELIVYGVKRAVIETALENRMVFTHFAFDYRGYYDIALCRESAANFGS